ncbi:hypothetical protein PTSG_02793 [Salpingoeca rosetta]|uniref:Carbamoyl phosphate synthase ATP-binding domain-containing protein n=1 Tax=Salpingoeca rosetta (strain ATCC 50818 / BSB-021) TaxID=946362 RepID=F2U3C4_SALR5|nr:uncharacterized protein PTSG_02793 [Salpingoeca rosetta]EGD82118.1 hypothetical protein PTSG_02793 [Salpingoeca rosetta]|eukprot:XP_004996301.1 hypothetical protein PTSG_02793 [Salpingoeca rosetta]
MPHCKADESYMLCTVKAPIAAYLTFDNVVRIAKEQKGWLRLPFPRAFDVCQQPCQDAIAIGLSLLSTTATPAPSSSSSTHPMAVWCSHNFMKVNPRIQVEHTVTEMVTGVDLVQSQLMLAGGATLQDIELEQDTIATCGFSINARITTDDPLNDFSPDTGAHGLACQCEPFTRQPAVGRELEPYTTAAPPPAHGDEGEVDEASLGPFDVLVHHTGMLELVRVLLGKQQGVISITPLDEHQGRVARVQLTARRDPDCPAWMADELWSVWVEPVSEGIEEVLPSLAKANGGFHSHMYKPDSHRVRDIFRFVSRESAELMVRLYDQREVLGTKLNVFPDPKAKNWKSKGKGTTCSSPASPTSTTPAPVAGQAQRTTVQATLERAGVNVQSLQVFPDLCCASVDVVADSEETFRSLLPLPIDTAASACRLEARQAPLHRIVVTCTPRSKPTTGRDIVQAFETNFGGKAKLVPIPQSLKDTLSHIHPFANTRMAEQEQEQGAQQQQQGGGGSEEHDADAMPNAVHDPHQYKKDGDAGSDDSKSSKSGGASSETTLQRVFVLETTDTRAAHACVRKIQFAISVSHKFVARLCYPNDVHVAVLDPKLGGLLSDLVDAFNKGSVAKDLDVLAAVTMGNHICFTGSTAVLVWSQAKLLASFLAPAFRPFARSDRVLGDDKIMEHVLNDYGFKLVRYPTLGLLPYADTAHGAMRDVEFHPAHRITRGTPAGAYTHVRPGRRGAILLEYSLYYYLDQDRERGLSYINSTVGANIKSQTTISVTGMQYRFLDSQLLELARKFRVYVRKPSAEDRDACASSVPMTVEGMQRQLTAFDNAVQDTLKDYMCHMLGLPVIDTSHVPEMSEADLTFLKRKLFNYLTKAGRTVCRSKDDVVSYIAPQDVIGTPTERNTVIPTTESTFHTIAHIQPTWYVCQVPMSVAKELVAGQQPEAAAQEGVGADAGYTASTGAPSATANASAATASSAPSAAGDDGASRARRSNITTASKGCPVNFSAHAVLKGPRMEVVAASEVMLLTTYERLFPAKVKQAVWEVEPYQYHTISETLLAVQLHAEIREGSITNDRDMNAERSGPLAVQRGARDHVRTCCTWLRQTLHPSLAWQHGGADGCGPEDGVPRAADDGAGQQHPLPRHVRARVRRFPLFEVIDEVDRDGTFFLRHHPRGHHHQGPDPIHTWLYTGPTYTVPPSNAELDNKAAWNGLTHDATLLVENAFNKYRAGSRCALLQDPVVDGYFTVDLQEHWNDLRLRLSVRRVVDEQRSKLEPQAIFELPDRWDMRKGQLLVDVSSEDELGRVCARPQLEPLLPRNMRVQRVQKVPLFKRYLESVHRVHWRPAPPSLPNDITPLSGDDDDNIVFAHRLLHVICKSELGLTINYASAEGYFGSGLYFSHDPSFAVKYGHHEGSAKDKNDTTSERRVDTDMFVIYDNGMCYPEYIICLTMMSHAAH